MSDRSTTDRPGPDGGHLDDERLSAALDGEALDDGDHRHLHGCPSCGARQEALAGAARAVAAAPAPLEPAAVDAMIAAAVATAGVGPAAGAGAGGQATAGGEAGEAPAVAGVGAASRAGSPQPGGGVGDGRAGAGEAAPGASVVDLDGRRRSGPGRHRRVRPRRHGLPPVGFVVTAAAAIAALAGLAGLLGGTGTDQAGRTTAAGPRADEASGAAGESLPPAMASRDLGPVDDPETLTRLLASTIGADQGAGGDDYGAADPETARRTAATPGSDDGTPAPAPAPPEAATLAAPAPARCTAAARAVGGDALGPHLATARTVWQGRPAEVLVYALAQPAAGLSRQAYVFGDPGCDLLADPRF